jgi:hypothetical protein
VSAHHHTLGTSRITSRQLIVLRLDSFRNDEQVESLTGPMIVACHWKRLSPIGPAEHELGGSRPRSMSSCWSVA